MKNKAATFRVLKTCISVLMFAVGGMFMATAQNPGIPYQAYIIDEVGGYAPGKQIEVPLANADILLEFEIRNENGVVEYKERIPAKTDEFGMVSTVIGVGNGTTTVGAFEEIIWNGKSKIMHIDSDLTGTGSNFNDHGEMELVHIPGPSGVVITPGIGAPTATNPSGPNAGDIYVDEATGDLYTFDGTNWVPQPGVAINPGAGAPTATNPANPDSGDVYVDESTGEIYVYDGTSWVNTVDANETVTTLVDHGDGTSTYTDENNQPNPIINTVIAANASIADGTIDIDGDGTADDNVTLQDVTDNINNIIDANETLTTLEDHGDGTSTYTDEDGKPNLITNTATAANVSVTDGSIDIDGDGTADDNVTLQDVTSNINNIIDANETLTTLEDHGDGTSTYTDEDGQPKLITNTATAANVSVTDGSIDINGDGIADSNVTLQDVTSNINNIIGANETDTSLAQDTGTGVITYIAEDGQPDKANVVSAAPDNIVKVGSDGGAFVSQADLNEPWFGTDDNAGATQINENIYHMGQVGIGTTTPEEKLHVLGRGRFQGAGTLNYLEFGSNAGHSFMEFGGGKEFTVWNKNATRFTIADGTGNVGIGIYPTEKLDVNGSVKVRTLLTGAATDEVVVVDAYGVLKKRAAASNVTLNKHRIEIPGGTSTLNKDDTGTCGTVNGNNCQYLILSEAGNQNVGSSNTGIPAQLRVRVTLAGTGFGFVPDFIYLSQVGSEHPDAFNIVRFGDLSQTSFTMNIVRVDNVVDGWQAPVTIDLLTGVTN